MDTTYHLPPNDFFSDTINLDGDSYERLKEEAENEKIEDSIEDWKERRTNGYQENVNG